MHLVRLVFTLISPLCHELCGTRALMCGLASHTVSCSAQHGQIETLTAKTQHGIALALTVEFVVGGSLGRLLFEIVNIVCFAILVRY